MIYAYQNQQVSSHQSMAPKAITSKCLVRMSDIDATIITSDNEPSSQLEVKNEDNWIISKQHRVLSQCFSFSFYSGG